MKKSVQTAALLAFLEAQPETINREALITKLKNELLSANKTVLQVKRHPNGSLYLRDQISGLYFPATADNFHSASNWIGFRPRNKNIILAEKHFNKAKADREAEIIKAWTEDKTLNAQQAEEALLKLRNKSFDMQAILAKLNQDQKTRGYTSEQVASWKDVYELDLTKTTAEG